MGDVCSVNVVGQSPDGKEQYVEDSCKGETRVEPVLPGPLPAVPSQVVFTPPTGTSDKLVSKNKHFTQPGVLKPYCTYDPSLNMTLNPDIVDARQIADMARQKTSCDPLQREVAQDSFTYSLKHHASGFGKILDDIVDLIVPGTPDVLDGLVQLITELPKSESSKPEFKTILVQVASESAHPAIKSAALTVAKQAPVAATFKAATMEVTPLSVSATTTEGPETDSGTEASKVITIRLPGSAKTLLIPGLVTLSSDAPENIHNPRRPVPVAEEGARPADASRRPNEFLAIPSYVPHAKSPSTHYQILVTASDLAHFTTAVENPALILPSVPGGRELLDFLSPLVTSPEERDAVFAQIASALSETSLPTNVRPQSVAGPQTRAPSVSEQDAPLFHVTLAYRPGTHVIEIRLTMPGTAGSKALPGRNIEPHLPRMPRMPMAPGDEAVEETVASVPRRTSGFPEDKASFGIAIKDAGGGEEYGASFVPVPPALFQPQPRLETYAAASSLRSEATGERIAPKVAGSGNPSDHHGNGSGDADDSGGGERRGGQDHRGEGQGSSAQEDQDEQRRRHQEDESPSAYA